MILCTRTIRYPLTLRIHSLPFTEEIIAGSYKTPLPRPFTVMAAWQWLNDR
jgi:hypothetical protein